MESSLVFSIGQSLCCAVSEGEWKLTKHVLLCVSVRHLFRSKQLTTILHSIGHSESYDFGLELETHGTRRSVDFSDSANHKPWAIEWQGKTISYFTANGTTWIGPLRMCIATILSTVLVESCNRHVELGFESGKAILLAIIDKSQHRNLQVGTPETLALGHSIRIGPAFPDGSSLFYTGRVICYTHCSSNRHEQASLVWPGWDRKSHCWGLWWN